MAVDKSFYNWKRTKQGNDTEYKIVENNMTGEEARKIIADLIIRYDMDVDIDLMKLIKGKKKAKAD